LALLALSADKERFADQIATGSQFLERNTPGDGSYRLMRGRFEATWATALVLFSRAALGHTGLDRIADRLLQLRGRVLKNDPEIADMLDIDVRITGWPWAEGNFSWVEPTAWGCLALRRAGFGENPAVREGLQLLLDRAFDQGGINYGNRMVLGRMTEPIPTPTALMLLALQGTGESPRINAAVHYLDEQTRRAADLEHLCWAKLAFEAYAVERDNMLGTQRPVANTANRLAQLQEQIRHALTNAGTNIPIVRLALAIMALDETGDSSLRLPPMSLPEKGAANRQSVIDNRQTSVSFLSRLKMGTRNFFIRGLGALRQFPESSAVHIADASSYEIDLVPILKQQYEHFRAAVPLAGKRVVLKPNLVEYQRNKVINTDPRFVSAVIALCQQEGAAEIIVAEGPGHWRNVSFLVEESGLGEVLQRHNVPFIDLNHDEPFKMLNLGRLTGLDYLYLARTVAQADVFISLPKLKTHHWAGATLSLKNLFGILPGICYGWPKNELHWRGIPNSIVDIALTCTPHLAIVDGIVGMEGDGPLNGTAKPMGVLVIGADLVAVDATCCRLMGLDPKRVPYLVLGMQKKLGRMAETEIPQLGQSIAAKAQSFVLPPKIEKQLVAQPA
ncbi:MAG TPA: DUF362 domain-containing protein, partial [Gemmataceae bacterium]|nr:DUF362 domain-containing protein [Gemmataceae bacterium]